MAASTDSNAKVAAIYREAARRIERQDTMSCCMVAHLASANVPANHVPEARRYAAIFSPFMVATDIGDDHRKSFHYQVADLPDDDQQNFRVLALCFAAAMVEAGDA